MYYVNLLKSAILGILTILNVITNSVVVAVIARYPQLRDDRMTLFMFSLSASDLAFGCTFMPISAASCVAVTLQSLPELHFFFLNWFVSSSTFSLCGVMVSKTVAILRPLRCSQLLTTNRCYVAIVCGWVSGLLQAVWSAVYIGDVTWNVDMCSFRLPIDEAMSALHATLVSVGFISVFLLLGYCSVRIFVVVVRSHRQVAALAQSVGGATGSGSVGNVTRQSIRSARNVFVICVTSMALTSPLLSFGMLRHISNSYQSGLYSYVAMALYDCNSIMNSVLYMLLYRSVRRKTVQMLAELYSSCHRQ